MKKWDPRWNRADYSSDDNYWAGAKKACADIGMSLPDYSKLLSMYEAGKKDSSLGLPTSGDFWSSSELYDYAVRVLTFYDGYRLYYKDYSNVKVLCVGD